MEIPLQFIDCFGQNGEFKEVVAASNKDDAAKKAIENMIKKFDIKVNNIQETSIES